MARTFKALDMEENRAVMIKTPALGTREKLGTDAERKLLGRFAREGKILHKAAHPNIPKFYDEGIHRGLQYFAMEFIEGITLSRYLAGNRPRVIETACLAVPIAGALIATHAKNIYHRDLKPDNIMLTCSGRVYMIDFGIALSLDDDPTRYTELNVGTLSYMAPERLQGTADVPSSDLYSLGCILYLMLTGREPFASRNSGMTTEEQHLHRNPESLRHWAIDTPTEIDEFVLALLAKRYEDRPSSEDVIEVFKPYLPKLGAPEPNPGFDIDLTIPYREPRAVREVNQQLQGHKTPRAKFRRARQGDYLTRSAVNERIEKAKSDLACGDLQTACASLHALLEEAVATYGQSHEVVQLVAKVLKEAKELVD